MNLNATKSAVGPGITAFFLATAGAPPFTYAVLAGGAGGTIDPNTGFYTAPPVFNPDPTKRFDTVQATDSLGAQATAKIQVGNALILFCDILAHELQMPTERAYLWDQKAFQPKDTGLYVIVMVPQWKVLANWQHPAGDSGGYDVIEQYVNVGATLDVNIISRDNSALYRKEEAVMALASPYSEQQQETNQFFIGRNPSRIQDLSAIDGAAIPYRYQFSIGIQYLERKTQTPEVFTTFPVAPVVVNP